MGLGSRLRGAVRKIGHSAKQAFGYAKRVLGSLKKGAEVVAEKGPGIVSHYGGLFDRGLEALHNAEQLGTDVRKLIREADPRQFRRQIEELGRARSGSIMREPDGDRVENRAPQIS